MGFEALALRSGIEVGLQMATGRQNKLTGQVAEHLVCAELGRRGFIATPFAGNVPTFDVIAVDDACRAVPLQIKATRGNNFPTDAREWINLHLDEETGVQRYSGPRQLDTTDLIHVCVVLRAPGDSRRDRFFVLTKADVQAVCVASYESWMGPKGWRRPKVQSSFDCRYSVDQLIPFEDNWDLITRRLIQAEPPVAE